MKKSLLIKTLTLICAVCAMLFCLTACGVPSGEDIKNDDQPHEHEFSVLTNNDEEHWYECSCGEVNYKEHHSFNVKNDEKTHWYECHCGYKTKQEEHFSEQPATEYEDEICAECKFVIEYAIGHIHANNLVKVDYLEPTCTSIGNLEYYVCSCGTLFKDKDAQTQFAEEKEVILEMLEHNYTEIKYSNSGHWYECECGEPLEIQGHVPGEKETETTDQTCTICGYVITPALGHIHNLHLTKVEKSESTCTNEGNIEYYTCSCGKWFTDTKCETEITDKTTVLISKKEHNYTNLSDDENYHWYECSCGAKGEKVAHYGGEATCYDTAYCIVCSRPHGEIAEHKPFGDWIVSAKEHYKLCGYDCGQKLSLGLHDFDANKKCTICNYVTTALLGTEISSSLFEMVGTNFYVKVPNNYQEFDFGNDICVAEGATYKLFDASNNQINNKVGALAVGDNTFYITVTTLDNISKTYTFIVCRKSLYTVTFDSNGGSSVESQTVEEDGFAVMPEIPTKTGYTFNSWNYDFETPIIRNTTITANWDINEYTLTIVYNNGQDNLVLRKDYNSQIERFEEPYKEGYTFAGWDKQIPSTMPAENLTITATWDANEYTLTIVYDNGQEDLVITKNYNAEIERIEEPYKEGYTFAGWDNEIPYYMPSNNLIITATWDINEYSITLVYGNGQENKVITQNYDTIITDTLPILENDKIGYGFTGWDREMPSRMPSENITISAVWEKIFKTYAQYVSGLTDYGKTLKNLVVPSIYEDRKILGIYSSSFLGVDTFTSIEIEEGIETIESEAFKGCTSLESIKLPNSLTVIGSSAFENCTLLKTADLPSGLKNIGILAFNNCISLASVEIPKSVVYIGFNAFYGCNSLTNIFIPKTITNMGNSVFSNCASLTSIEFEYGVTSVAESIVSQCTSLTSVKIPSTVTEIESSAFYGCTSLRSIKLPSSLNSIGGNGFYMCQLEQVEAPAHVLASLRNDNLKSIKINGGTEIESYGLSYCLNLTSIEIPNYVTSIGENAFYECRLLKDIEIPNSVVSIGDRAFFNCISLESINIPSGVSILGNGVFNGCNLLNVVTIEEDSLLESIGDYAFSSCKSLTNIFLPSKLESISDRAFYNCESLLEIEIPSLITALNDSVFDGCKSLEKVKFSENSNLESIGNYVFYNCSSLTSLEIPNGVISIGNSAFDNCASLTSIEIPSSVTSIGYCAFYNCSSLTNVEIPFGVTNIDYQTFAYCSSLASVKVPNSVTSIGDYVFMGSGLTSVEIPNSVTSIGNWSFKDCSLLKTIEFEKNSNIQTITSNFIENDNIDTAIIPTSIMNIFSTVNLKSLIITEGTVIGSLSDIRAEYLEIPSSVITFNSQNYKVYNNLNKVNYLGTIDEWAQITFGNTYANPAYYTKELHINGVLLTHVNIQNATAISNYAFTYNESINRLTIGKNVTSIASDAFNYNYRLVEVVNYSTNITIEKGTGIGTYALSVYNGTDNYATKLTTDNNGFVIYTDGEEKILIGCNNLDTEITIPEGITKINDYAFHSCNKLQRVILPSTLKSIGNLSFNECSSLLSIELPNSVTSIGDYAFSRCYALTSIVIPNSVISLGERVFENCSALKSLTFADGCQLKNISKYAFNYCDNLKSVKIPSSIKVIEERAFKACYSLEEVSFSENGDIYKIGIEAFYNCALLKVQIPLSVTTIDNYAFGINHNLVIYCEASSKPSGWNTNWNSGKRPIVWDCLNNNIADNGVIYTEINGLQYALTDGNAILTKQKTNIVSANIPSSVDYNGTIYTITSIDSGVFTSCASLISVSIPSSVTTIAEDAFLACLSLKSISVDGNNPNYKSIDGNLYNKDGTILIRYASNKTDATFTIPSSVTSIGNYAFYESKSLISIVLPSSITTIGSNAFNGCNSLISVVIPNSVTAIGDYAFNGCISLGSIVIPKSITTIGYCAFYGGKSFIIYCEVESKPNGWDTWWNGSNCTVVWGYKG